MVGEHGSILQIKFKGNVSVKKTWDRKSKACGREEQQKKSWDPKSLSDLQVKMSCYLRVCFQEQISAFFFFSREKQWLSSLFIITNKFKTEGEEQNRLSSAVLL